jgi:hypothetical protein
MDMKVFVNELDWVFLGYIGRVVEAGLKPMDAPRRRGDRKRRGSTIPSWIFCSQELHKAF